jgi:hypothetical protein
MVECLRIVFVEALSIWSNTSALAAPRPIDLSADPLGFHRGHQQQATLQKPSAGFKASSPNLEAARCMSLASPFCHISSSA